MSNEGGDNGDFTPVVIRVGLKRADVAEIVRSSKVLSASPLVEALRGLAEQVFAKAIARRYPNKVVCFQQGETGDSLFLVLSGEVRLFARKQADAVELGSARPGDVLGEGEVLEGTSVRQCSAVAQGTVELAELSRASLLLSGRLTDPLKHFLAAERERRNAKLDELTDFMNRW